MSTKFPKWFNPDRKCILIQLFNSSGGFCVYGHKNCVIPEHHYSVYIEALIKDWIQLDREQARLDWEAECKALHHIGEPNYPLTGRFNAISKTIYADSQPLYFFEGNSVSGITLTPFVKVRLASSYMRLFIDLGSELKQVSKARRRKAIRYGKSLPRDTDILIRRKILEAVRDYLTT